MKRKWVPVAASMCAIVALVEMPYGYYMLLRLGYSAICVHYIIHLGSNYVTSHRLILVCLVVLYNPIFPVHLGSKVIWSIVNIGTVGYFWTIEIRLLRSEKAKAV